MVGLRNNNMTVEEISKHLKPMLSADLVDYGYIDDEIAEDETFDGEPIIRIKVNVEHAVPVDRLYDLLGKLHAELRKNNDERVVFLSAPGQNETPDTDYGQEDED